MDLFGSHVVVVGPRNEALYRDLESKGAHVHPLKSRSDAMKGIFALLTNKVEPDAVILSWRVNDPNSDQCKFFTLARRSVCNTAESIIDKIRKLMPDTPILLYDDYDSDIPQHIVERDGVYLVSDGKAPVDVLSESSSIEARRA